METVIRKASVKRETNETDISIVEIISLVGYENLTYFYKIFKEKYGYTPKDFRKS